MHRMVGVLAVLLAAFTVVMAVEVACLPKAAGDTPGLTLQLAADGGELEKLLSVKVEGYNAKLFWCHHTHLDNFYIPTYLAFFLGFIWMMGGGGTEAMHRLAWVACLTIAVAAVADGFENYHIFAALGASEIGDGTAAAIRHPSHIKWFSTAFTMGLIAILLFQRRPRPFGKIGNSLLAGVAALASVIGFGGFLDRRLFGLSLIVSLPIGLACISLLWLKKQKES